MSHPRRLPDTASVVHGASGKQLNAPSAERNQEAIIKVLLDYAPDEGQALELASGTGQHMAGFADALPRLTWQPSDVDAAKRASIDAWCSGLANVRNAIRLDAVADGWSRSHRAHDLIILVNLLHLISTPEARTLISETARALAPAGRFLLYGPFLRDGAATSEGDARFDASLRASDPSIGYKDAAEVRQWLADAGLNLIAAIDMPANNLTLISERPSETP